MNNNSLKIKKRGEDGNKIISVRIKEDILNGDFFYRYFGYGMRKFKKYKTVDTMHCLREGFLNILSAKAIASSVDAVVLHSDLQYNEN